MASTPLISPAEAMKALFIRSHLYELTLSRKKKKKNRLQWIVLRLVWTFPKHRLGCIALSTSIPKPNQIPNLSWGKAIGS